MHNNKKKKGTLVLCLHGHLYCLCTINLPPHSPLHFSHESINCSRLLSSSYCPRCNGEKQGPYSCNTPREEKKNNTIVHGWGDFIEYNYDVVEMRFA